MVKFWQAIRSYTKMKKEEFSKLFKRLYSSNPQAWNKVLESKRANTAPTKQNRQAMTQEAFKSLLKRDYNQFQDFSRKADATVNKPKSIRINGETLQKNKNTNQRNKNAETSYVDSSAVDSFEVHSRDGKTKDVVINFVGGEHGYMYPSVPNNVANGLYAAPSKGSYVNKVLERYSNINDPHVQEYIASGN